MSKHTPGPWWFRGEDRELAVIGSGYGTVVVFEYEPSEEDARLIVAAPDLLDAAKAAHEYICNASKCWSSHDDPSVTRCFHCDEFMHLAVWPEHGNPNCEVKKILTILEAAITKARGESK